MKVRLNDKEIIAIAKKGIHHGRWKIESMLQSLLLKGLGLLLDCSGHRYCRSLSPDGRYAVSWSWRGLIYLICLDFFCPPSVVSFAFEPERGLWEVKFSKDMQQIIITHKDGSTSILSAVPGEGFYRRQVPIVQDCSMKTGYPLSDIVEFISQTSSAYWKHIDDLHAKTRWKLPTPFIPSPTTVPDCDWEQWISHGKRYLDIPRDTCELDG
jgi:hypothetical protein